jgi:hypothetical protein
MLQRMPFANADRLVMVWERSPRTSNQPQRIRLRSQQEGRE